LTHPPSIHGSGSVYLQSVWWYLWHGATRQLRKACCSNACEQNLRHGLSQVSIDYRIVPGSFPNPVVSVGVCYPLVGRCRRRLDHGMVGYCVGVLLFTSFVVPLVGETTRNYPVVYRCRRAVARVVAQKEVRRRRRGRRRCSRRRRHYRLVVLILSLNSTKHLFHFCATPGCA